MLAQLNDVSLSKLLRKCYNYIASVSGKPISKEQQEAWAWACHAMCYHAIVPDDMLGTIVTASNAVLSDYAPYCRIASLMWLSKFEYDDGERFDIVRLVNNYFWDIVSSIYTDSNSLFYDVYFATLFVGVAVLVMPDSEDKKKLVKAVRKLFYDLENELVDRSRGLCIFSHLHSAIRLHLGLDALEYLPPPYTYPEWLWASWYKAFYVPGSVLSDAEAKRIACYLGVLLRSELASQNDFVMLECLRAICLQHPNMMLSEIGEKNG